MKTNPNDPISPSVEPIMDTDRKVSYKIGDQFYLGLTKREYFAAMAMASYIAAARNPETYESIAIRTVGMADALIAELNK